MTDDAALLRAILAAPHEDTPRLVYADWLQEHGQDARAEFIRVQCRLATCDVCNPAEGPAWDWSCGHKKLRQQERDLFSSNIAWSGWRGSPVCRDVLDASRLDDLRRLTGCVFSRGFVSELALPTDAFLQHAQAIFAAHPVERVTLTGYRVEIDPPAPDHGWQLYFYLPEEEGSYFAMSGALFTREEMVARLIQDVRDLETEFA